MASGTISLTSSKAWRGKITWESTPNTAGNYSDVYVYVTMWKTDGYLTSSNSPTSGTITINGSDHNLIGYQEFKDEVCIFEDTIRVYHNDDGNKTITISLSCKGQSGTSLSSATLSGSGTAVLDTIHRSGTLSADSGTLGEKQTLTIDSASSLTSTITYECGDLSGTIVSKTTKKTVEWTPPIALAEANPNGTSVTVKLTLTTYSGNTAVGTNSISVFYSIPSSVVPTFTVAISDAAGYKNTYGDYLQMLSKLHIVVSASSPYGGNIKSYKITANGETFADSEATTSEVTSFGDIQVRVEVVDSRNRVAQETFYVSVRQYTLPTVSSLTVKRCNQNGTANDQGAYIQVTYAASVTSLDNQNTANYKLQYKKTSATSFTTVNLTQFKNVFNISSTYTFAADTGASYEVQLVATDSFVSITKSTLGSTAATIMHFKADGKGIGLGKVAEVVNAVDVGWNMQMNSHRIMGLADPVDDGDAVSKKFLEEYIENLVPDEEETGTILDQVWPVGSIYISATSTSPASLFGGEWSQIEDMFLLAAGSKYSFGSTGGEATHVLTEDEMPSHYHDFCYSDDGWNSELPAYMGRDGRYSDSSYLGVSNAVDEFDSYEVSTSDVGGGAAHNNMPPYLAVNVWMRMG